MFAVGTEVGLLKLFSPSSSSSKRKREEQVEEQNINTIGKVDREKEIQIVKSCKYNNKTSEIDALVLIRKNGEVEILDESGKTLWQTNVTIPNGKTKSSGVNGAAWASANRFVGLDYRDGTLITCTGTGILTYTNSTSKSYNLLPTEPTNSGLNTMQVHPTDIAIVATGGEELDLQIWHIKDTQGKLQPIWKAKNLPNDKLDLRVPVWITSLCWVPSRLNIHQQKIRGHVEKLLPDQACQIVVGTGYGQVRFYDVCGEQKRPLLNQVVTPEEKPIRSIATGDYQGQPVALVGDTIGNALIVDLKDGKSLATLSPSAGGSITAISCQDNFLATASIDRFVRVYDLDDDKRKMLSKFYLKQRTTSMTILGTLELPEEEQDGEDATEDVWEQMPVVKKKKTK